jgi:hypothetical protein
MAENQTINVERLEVLKTGAKNGRAWTLTRVHAKDAHGRPFDHELRTFDALPIGLVPVEVEPYEIDGTVQHYTVKLPKGARPKPGKDADTAALAERVERLERQMKALLSNADIELPA